MEFRNNDPLVKLNILVITKNNISSLRMIVNHFYQYFYKRLSV